MRMSKSKKIILLDCDLISHFIVNNCLEDLPKILSPHECYVVDYVYDEIKRHQLRKAFIDNQISCGAIQLMNFPHSDIDIKKEFALIKTTNYLVGDGERACMAIASQNKEIIASSNFRDVAPYCVKKGIHYLGTLDILILAHEKELYDENKCDDFIKNAIAFNKARFPTGVNQIRFYTPRDLSFI